MRRDRMIVDRRTWLAAVAWRMAFFLSLGLVVKLHPPLWLLLAAILAVGVLRIVTFIVPNRRQPF